MSNRRTLTLCDTPSLLRGRQITPTVPSWPAKDPSDVIDLAADFTAIIPPAVTISWITCTLTGDLALRVVQQSVMSNLATVRVCGGTDGATPTVLITAALSNGTRLTRGIALPVISQGAQPASSPDALTTNGLPLLTNGQPLVTTLPPDALLADGLILTAAGQPLTTTGAA